MLSSPFLNVGMMAKATIFLKISHSVLFVLFCLFSDFFGPLGLLVLEGRMRSLVERDLCNMMSC